MVARSHWAFAMSRASIRPQGMKSLNSEDFWGTGLLVKAAPGRHPGLRRRQFFPQVAGRPLRTCQQAERMDGVSYSLKNHRARQEPQPCRIHEEVWQGPGGRSCGTRWLERKSF